MLSYCSNLKKGRPLAFALALTLALTAIMSIAGFVYAAPVGFDPVSIQEGEPVEIVWDYWTDKTKQSPYNGTVSAIGSDYIPDSFLVWVDDPDNASAVTAIAPATAVFQYKSADGSSSAYLVDISGLAGATTVQPILTVVVNDKAHPDWEGTFNVASPPPNGTPPGGTPYDDNGYLPIGQYARGNGWGSLFSDGTNVTGNTKKFLAGQESTGVSLGVGGGYVQFEMTGGGIANDPDNSYGVDFIVYGNAFNGNPEAGSVKVSTDGAVWYDLAGSLYYNDTTLRNIDVTYKLAGDDIQYSTNGGLTWDTTTFQRRSGWWPSYTASGNNGNYQRVWNINNKVSGVSWDYTNNVITYGGVSIVPFSSLTDYYQFGYADVHANGSSYGKAANPYTVTSESAVGDGFDLSWAVDGSGNPVNLPAVKYVRVYSAVINDAGILGETSTEVTGLFTTANEDGGAATTDLGVYDVNYVAVPTSNLGTETITIPASTPTTYYIYSAEPNVFINSDKVDASNLYPVSVTLASGQTAYYRIITQHDMESAYITLLKFVAQ